ncbi:MAG: TRAP transporter small permease [SAR324 cluster bacterium]|nr:TRAP transporter small permease [SAR324 cluster bacterium]
MEQLLHVIDRLNRGMALVAAVLLGGVVLLILLEIFLWNFFEATTLVADEYSAYALAILVFWGAGLTLREGGHIRIELILNLFPNRWARWIEFLATCTATFFTAYLLLYLYRMVAGTWHYSSTSGTLTSTPLWVPQAIMLLGAVAFFMQLFATLLRSVQKLKSS